LAGVAIAAIVGDNGLIFFAQDSNERQRGEAVDKEALMWKENARLVYGAGGEPKPLGGINEEGILKELLDKKLMTEEEVLYVLEEWNTAREVEIGGKTISFLLEFIEDGEDMPIIYGIIDDPDTYPNGYCLLIKSDAVSDKEAKELLANISGLTEWSVENLFNENKNNFRYPTYQYFLSAAVAKFVWDSENPVREESGIFLDDEPIDWSCVGISMGIGDNITFEFPVAGHYVITIPVERVATFVFSRRCYKS